MQVEDFSERIQPQMLIANGPSPINNNSEENADFHPHEFVEAFQQETRGLYKNMDLQLNVRRSSEMVQMHMEILMKYKAEPLNDKSGF